MQLASRIWFCWKWLAWGKDALGAVQHLLAFVGLSQGIAFDSSDDDDCKPRRVKSCRLKRPSVFKTWSCQVMLGPSPPCWAVVQDGWGSRRQRSCQAGLQAPWGEVWMQQPGHHSISTTILLKKKACQAAMWSHLSEGKSAFEDDLKEKNAESPNVNLRSHLVRWILFVLGQASENNKIFTLIEVSPSQSLTSLGAIQVLHKIFLSVRLFLFEKNLEDPMMENWRWENSWRLNGHDLTTWQDQRTPQGSRNPECRWWSAAPVYWRKNVSARFDVFLVATKLTVFTT